MEKCGIEIDATVSGEFTRELWELTLASLRANFRSSLSSSPLDVSAAYLLQRAGGVSAVRQDVIRFLSEAIQRKAQVEHNLRVMGEVKFTEDISELGDRFSPGTPFTLHLRAELHPRVRFKRSYKGLNLRVPRQPYVKGHLFKLTTDYLLYKHSTVTDYPESAHPADEGDSVLLQVEFGWFEERDGSFGPKIPSEFICGETTLDLLRPWIPVELLGAVKGISLGERRTVKLAIPFSTSQLLEINARQAYDASEEQQTDVGERRMTEGCSEEGRSLVPLYLQSLAGTEKDKFLRKFFSQEGESPGDVGGTAASEVASAADTGDASTEERSNIAGKEQVGISGDTYEDSGEEAEDEIHHIDCLLQVKCVGVKRRIWPAADDAFFQKACQMSRAELWEKIEAAAEDLAKNAASKHALGAAAQALDEISQVDVPESLFDAQANATWKQQLRAREIQGENDKKNRTKEDFMKWKEENRRGIESILTTAFAIQAVYKREGLQVDEKKLQADLAKALLQTTGEAPEAVLKQLYKKAQAALVYKFILEHANVEYYVNDTPAEITVQPDGTAVPQQGVRAFPRGVDVEEWHKTRRETVKERDNLRKQAERFYIDPKTVKKLDNDNSTKPE
ncbi:hypothetical protein, conserved [Eimeria tenella]|uniref:Trigger factor C-terminal domain-containing protein n=1 Tax=Eimeria tenella TaxID=5802 RepID=U6L349_EIMTE|nr:hypothetical protein, conserved [Eimeria tenella]CDJ43019.1 hypothetical protein, conserved [Eimeria tenella]|eukprot:XP_013233769.1 hypothetical protein, conserved [Eimeria tenella]